MTVTGISLMDRWMDKRKRFSCGTITSATETYATGGIVLPAAALNKFGFVRQIDSLEISGQPGGGTVNYVLKATLPTVTSSPTIKLQSYEEESLAAGGPMPESPAVALTDGVYHFCAVGW